jgi:hypothetical protein
VKAIQLCLFSPGWEEEITFHPEERLKNKKKGGSKRKIEEAQGMRKAYAP